MANLDVGTGSPDAGPQGPDQSGPGPQGPQGGPPGGAMPFAPPGAMARMRPSMPGAGNVGDALQKVAQAAQLLKEALMGLPHGSKESNEVTRVLSTLGRIGPSPPDVAQTGVTDARDRLRQMVQMVLANRAQQVRGQNPQQMPTTAQPGV